MPASAHQAMNVVVVDNFDSFTNNIVDLLKSLDARVTVVTNRDRPGIETRSASHLILGPGPGHVSKSDDRGFSADWLDAFRGRVPILGICFGHQLIAYLSGGTVERSDHIRHGVRVNIKAEEHSILHGGSRRTHQVMRYHSFCVDRPGAGYSVTARDVEDGTVMAIENPRERIFGMQYHPESIGTPEGHRFMKNFLLSSE